MINEHDIKDWEIFSIPVKLNKLTAGDFFSVLGDNRVFKVLCVANQITFAETEEIFNSFALPNFMEVFQCKLK
jgi:hypothetical protein